MKRILILILFLSLLTSCNEEQSTISNDIIQSTDTTISTTSIPSPPVINAMEQSFDGSTVSVVHSQSATAEDISDEEVRLMVNEAISLSGELDEIVKDGQTVILKPNLVQMKVDSTGELLAQTVNGVTTDWRVTNAVADIVRTLNPNGKIYVMEGSASGKTLDVMKYLHYTPEYMESVDGFFAFESDSGDWQDLDSPKLVKVSLEDGLLHKEYYFNKLFYEADVVISIPCLKTTSGVVVTAGIKNVSLGTPPGNIYGVSPDNPSKVNMVSHKIVDGELDKWIYDYFICKPIDYVVVDGLQGFQSGPVPMSGERTETDKMNMGLIISGKDAISVDTVCALITGWDPESIGYLNHFRENNIGNGEVSNILVKGSKIHEIRKYFTLKLPNLGGSPIEDKGAPNFNIENHELVDGKLAASIKAENEIEKIEVYIDNCFYTSISKDEGLDNIIIDYNELKGTHNVTLYAYDKFYYSSEQSFECEFN